MKKQLSLVIGSVAAASLIALTGSHEGVSLKPYSDTLAGNIQTVCFGETHVRMRAYTLPECQAMLDASLSDYALAVRNLTPGFDVLSEGQKVAVVDFAYNAGITNYSKSTLRKKYAAQDFPAACDEFLRWRFVNGGKTDCGIPANKCGGIMARRVAERKACLGE